MLDVDRSILTASVHKGRKAKPKKRISPNVEAETSPLSPETIDAFLSYFDLGLIETGADR
jgi:hypothetical protein